MSLFNRMINLFKKAEPPRPEKTLLSLGPGDIVEVSLVTYQVTGQVKHAHRNAVCLTLQDGESVKYLYIEDREKPSFHLYSAIDGRLDSFDEVPTSIEMEEGTYYLEEQYSGNVMVVGKSPFSQTGEQYIWQYQSDDYKLLRIEWQDGRFMLYEGEAVLPADVQVIRGT